MVDDKLLLKLFKNNPNPSDGKIHSFAKAHGVNEHRFEEKVYSLLSSFASKGRAKNFKGKYNKKQMVMGTDIEKEHTSSPPIAARIAKDHLAEIPDYYTRLVKMERSAEKNAAFIIGFSKMAAQLLGAQPMKPQKALVTPEMNSKNKSIIEGVATNKLHKEQITNKKMPPKAQFKLGFFSGVVKGISAMAMKHAPKLTKGLSKAWGTGISNTMAKYKIPGAGSIARGLKKVPKGFKPATFGDAATYGAIGYGLNKALG